MCKKMTATPYKFKMVQDAVDTTKSKQLNFIFPPGKNAYRLSYIRIQCTLDAVVTTDALLFQFSYKDLNGVALETIDQDDEIYTDGLAYIFQGAPAEIEYKTASLKDTGIFWMLEKFITKDTAFLNIYTRGQAGGVKTFYIELEGQYVSLAPDVIAKLQKKTVL